MTSPQVEVQTTERAILCADGHSIHFGSEYFKDRDPADLIQFADHSPRGCRPHSFATREHIVTAWTEANT